MKTREFILWWLSLAAIVIMGAMMITEHVRIERDFRTPVTRQAKVVRMPLRNRTRKLAAR